MRGKTTSRKAIDSPAAIPKGKPRMKLDLERSEGIPHLSSPGQRDTAMEEDALCRSRGEPTVGAPLPDEPVITTVGLHRLHRAP
jgi:hypothetical protein